MEGQALPPLGFPADLLIGFIVMSLGAIFI